VVVGSGRLEGLVTEGCGLEGEEARHFEQIELAVAGLWDGVSRDVCVHDGEGVLLTLLLDGLGRAEAVCATLVVARVELLIVELALTVQGG
jgi:hypothetical protein